MKKLELLTVSFALVSLFTQAMEDNANSVEPSEASKPTIQAGQYIHSDIKEITNFTCKKPYVQVGAPTVTNYHYPKANPALGVWVNVKDLAEQGAYGGFHDYVRQSVTEKFASAEIGIRTFVANWYSGGDKEKKISGMLEQVMNKELAFKHIKDLLDSSNDEAERDNLKKLIFENRTAKYTIVAAMSQEAVSYVNTKKSFAEFKIELFKLIKKFEKEIEADQHSFETVEQFEETKKTIHENYLKMLHI